ncbi:MAG: GNAT family N-acetyltransferase [Candidatus Babeliales bacterium]|nr:GNAT family N-acetyltransferase [Candidatus Babeliales bacterium]
MELDRKVTYEFFKPLFIDIYTNLGIKNDIDNDLEEELKNDSQTFSNLIQSNGIERLHVAWDTLQNIPCGLLLFHKEENNEIMLDLLLVDKNYRGQGIGKRLVNSTYKTFDGIKIVTVYPVQFNNKNTLKFYESLGFKNLGVGPFDKINIYGIRYSDMYYHFKLDMP